MTMTKRKEEKNEKMKRPLSYHITIWKWELPAILSTFHRGTGAALALVSSTSGIVLGFGLFDLTVVDALALIRVSSNRSLLLTP